MGKTNSAQLDFPFSLFHDSTEQELIIITRVWTTQAIYDQTKMNPLKSLHPPYQNNNNNNHNHNEDDELNSGKR